MTGHIFRVGSIVVALWAVLAIPATAEEDPDTMERLRLLEIMRTARPAPNPPSVEGFSPLETDSPEQRATIQYDPASGTETVLPASATDAGEQPLWDGPGAGAGAGFEDPEGWDLTVEGTTPTPPTAHPDNTASPWNTIHKLLMRFNVGGTDYYYVCSGWAAGSFHVVTAGHCVYSWDPNGDGNTSDRTWASEIWVWAGQGDVVEPVGDPSIAPDRPFGEAKGVLFRSYTGWTDSHNFSHDWGVITLNRRDGDHTGWMGRESDCANSLNFSGYPTETPYVPSGSVVQYYGYDADNVVICWPYTIDLDAYIYGGHSGGPSWRYEGSTGNRYVEGIHSTSNRVGSATDTRLTSAKRSSLDGWMADDESERPPVSRPDLIEYDFDGNNRKDLLTNAAAQGETVQVEYNLLNSGFAATGTFTVSFYLSTNRIISTSDSLIGTRSHSLSAWSFLNPTTSLTVPVSVPTGSYYLGWIASGGASEYTTSNNAVVIGDETLTVTPQRLLTVTTPNGGESWRIGDVEPITWTSTNAGPSVKVELSRDLGGSWSTLAASTPNDGLFQWTVTPDASASCLVRIGSTAYPAVADTSNGSFAISTSCGYPEDVVLSHQTVNGPLAVTACSSITAGDGYVLSGGADVSLTAGHVVVLANGLAVEAGAALVVAINDTLAGP